jgi:hypothetical protein
MPDNSLTGIFNWPKSICVSMHGHIESKLCFLARSHIWLGKVRRVLYIIYIKADVRSLKCIV